MEDIYRQVQRIRAQSYNNPRNEIRAQRANNIARRYWTNISQTASDRAAARRQLDAFSRELRRTGSLTNAELAELRIQNQRSNRQYTRSIYMGLANVNG